MFSFDVRLDGKVEISGYTAGRDDSAIQIPAIINGMKVVKIKDRAFVNQRHFTFSVEILNGVVEIGTSAFENCEFLEVIIIPPSVKVIGERAFANCQSLSEVRFIGDVPDRIGADIFRNTFTTKVFYNPTTNGWFGDNFQGFPLLQMGGVDLNLSEQSEDDGENEVYRDLGDESVIEQQIFQEEKDQEELLWQEERVEYMADIKAHERTEFGYEKTTSLKNVSNPREAFKIRLTSAFQKLNQLLYEKRAAGKQVIELQNERDLNTMIDSIILVNHIEFKNPLAFLLGYVSLNPRTGNVDRERFKKIQDMIHEISPKEDVLPADVLRYAFFWVDLKRQMAT